MGGQVIGGLVEDLDEIFVGVAVGEIFPPVGDQYGDFLAADGAVDVVEHGTEISLGR